MDDLSSRLDRIDTKLDKLTDAISQLARIEERISHQNQNMIQLDAQFKDMEDRIRQLEYQGGTRGVLLRHIERFGWLLISAVIGLLAYFFRER